MRIIFLFLFIISNSLHSNVVQELANAEIEIFQNRKINKKMLDKTWNYCQSRTDAKCFKRYQVKNRQVFGDDTSIKHLLEKLNELYVLPNIDFIYFHMDILNTSNNKKSFLKQAPIFAPCKSVNSNNVILLIDWYYDISNFNEGGWNQIFQSINEHYNQYPWDLRRDALCWRGSIYDGWYTPENWKTNPRGKLVYLSKLDPQKIDAGFVSFAWWHCSDIDWFENNIGKASFLKPYEQMNYKYLCEIDGVTATYPAFQWKLLTGSCVLKQNSNDILWWHRGLKPWVHYIPVERDLSDLNEKLNWAISHSEESKKIGLQARQFVLDNLNIDGFLEYSYRILNAYAEICDFKNDL